MTKASAPGKVILFGEHAVVYDKVGIATSIDKRCIVEVRPNKENKVSIEIKNLGLKRSMSEKELFNLLETIEKAKSEKRFDEIKDVQKRERLSAPFFVVAKIMKDYGFMPVILSDISDVPKNLGSGSSAFAALALALSRFLGKELTRKEIAELSYEGDVVAHGGTPSGIDSSIVTFGGYIKYKKSEGTKNLDINFEIPLIFVDSGEPATTGETVPYIRKQREENKEFVDKVLENLDDISNQSLEALQVQNLSLMGELMLEYYLELKKLNISTEKLDKVIEIAIKNNALGAKPTGGWGGGCCVVLARDQTHVEELLRIYKEHGFNCFQTKIGVDGVKAVE